MDLLALPAASPGSTVVVETVLLGISDHRLTYRFAQQGLADGDHPDALARRLAGFDPRADVSGRMVHSTSWRFTDGRILLTYAALPDPDPGTAATLVTPAAPAAGPDPLSPSPEHVSPADVVVHACRHLAFLHHTDPVIAAASPHHPGLWALLAGYRPDVAGARRPAGR